MVLYLTDTNEMEATNMKYDVIIVGAGPGGIFSAYELMKRNLSLKSQYLKKVIH